SGGPLGNRMFFKSSQPVEAAAPARGMGDVHAVRLLDTIMREENGPRSAVVIVQAETAIHYFGDARTFAGRLGEWFRLPSTNANICLFLFAAYEYAELCEAVKGRLPELYSHLIAQQ